MIYFVQPEGEPFVKIGHAGNIPKRLQGLQNGNHRRLKVLGLLEGERDKEQALHGQFGHLHVHGEWFRLEDQLLTFTQELPKPKAKPRGKLINGYPADAPLVKDWFDKAKFRTDAEMAAAYRYDADTIRRELGPSGRGRRK